MYTANAVAYKTGGASGQHIAEEDMGIRTYASPIEHEIPSLALAETPKYRQTAANGHESEKIEESDRCFGDHRVVRCGHQQPFVCGRGLP